MGEGALEKVMLTFADGAADVLVCTTIIESGLDIPNANTIVIDRADTLGLAQLYQLRGRVGRSSRRAYAYLMYRRRERMSEEARKRLQAIFNASELGAGFQIALADLEIRGAGNILGGEQSGHMAAVGFDLYSRLLAEAVEEAKARREFREPVREAPQAVVDLPVDAHLPDDYVPDVAQKLELYRRLARARSIGDLAAFRQEVTDRYGPMPQPVLRLVEVAELRLSAESAGVASLAREEGWLVVRFGTGMTRATAMQLLAPAGVGGPLPGRAARRHDVRLEPGAHPPAARPAQGLDADPGRGVPAGRRHGGGAGRGAMIVARHSLPEDAGMDKSPAVDRYLSSLSAERRPAMEALRAAVNVAAPNATETIAYGMPALRSHGGQFLVSYDAYKRHYSLFPASEAVIEAGGDELTPYLAGKGTIQFPADEPIPTDLVTRIVKARVEENAERARS